MNCPTRRNEDAEIVLDYCTRTLESSQVVEFEAHLKQCGDCTRLVNAQREVWQDMETWTAPEVSVDFDARLYARIAQEQAAPQWKLWLRRIFQPAVPYAVWKAAVPAACACAVLAVSLFVRTPDVTNTPQLHADKVDIEQVEQALEDLEMLTPASQAPAGSM